jgi:hypothetical protein
MSKFQQRLCDFLSECKHDALQELSDNAAYIGWKKKCTELHGSLMEQMPPDCREAFAQYQETVSAMSGMESDYSYLCGIRDYLGIERQFDRSQGLWSELVSHMIHATPGD